jgi:hypothetical protein
MANGERGSGTESAPRHSLFAIRHSLFAASVAEFLSHHGTNTHRDRLTFIAGQTETRGETSKHGPAGARAGAISRGSRRQADPVSAVKDSRAPLAEDGRDFMSQHDVAASNAVGNIDFEQMTRPIQAMLEAQKSFVDAVTQMNSDWLDHAQSEVRLATELSSELSSARSLPDATSAYQRWLRGQFEILAEDGRRFYDRAEQLMRNGDA